MNEIKLYITDNECTIINNLDIIILINKRGENINNKKIYALTEIEENFEYYRKKILVFQKKISQYIIKYLFNNINLFLVKKFNRIKIFDNYTNSPQVEDIMIFFLIVKKIKLNKIKNIIIDMKNHNELSLALYNYSIKRNILVNKVNYKNKKVLGTFNIKNTFILIVDLIIFLVYRNIKYKKLKKIDYKADFLVTDYFTEKNREDYSPYWNNVFKDSKNVFNLYIPPDLDGFSSMISQINRFKKFKNDKSNVTHFLDEIKICYVFQLIPLIFLNFLYSILFIINLKFKNKYLNVFLFSFFKDELKDSFWGGHFLILFLFNKVINEKLKFLKINKKYFLLCEGQLWERIILNKLRFENKPIFLYFHTPLRFFDFRLYTIDVYNPETYFLVVDNKSIDFMKGIYDTKKTFQIEALRYLHLASKLSYNTSFKYIYTIFGDYLSSYDESLIEIFKIISSENNSIYFQPHPLRANSFNIEFKMSSEALLHSSEIIITGGTTNISLEALYLKKKLLIYILPNRINLSSAFNRTDKKIFIDMSTNVKTILNYLEIEENNLFLLNLDDSLALWKDIIR